VHGKFAGTVETDKDDLIINGHRYGTVCVCGNVIGTSGTVLCCAHTHTQTHAYRLSVYCKIFEMFNVCGH
jgi:hypothetical protein